MIIIAFATNTSKILPRIFCRRFRHCAPIIQSGDKLIMYQFVRRNHISKIQLSMRDIRILKSHGWKFVYLSQPAGAPISGAYTCVNFTKRAIKLRAPFIQTPNALYKYLIFQMH